MKVEVLDYVMMGGATVRVIALEERGRFARVVEKSWTGRLLEHRVPTRSLSPMDAPDEKAPGSRGRRRLVQ